MGGSGENRALGKGSTFLPSLASFLFNETGIDRLIPNRAEAIRAKLLQLARQDDAPALLAVGLQLGISALATHAHLKHRCEVWALVR